MRTANGSVPRTEPRRMMATEEAGLVRSRQADPQQHDRTRECPRDHHLVRHGRAHAEADDHIGANALGKLGGGPRILLDAEVLRRRCAGMPGHRDRDQPSACQRGLGHHLCIRTSAAHPAGKQQHGPLSAGRTRLDHLPCGVHDWHATPRGCSPSRLDALAPVVRVKPSGPHAVKGGTHRGSERTGGSPSSSLRNGVRTTAWRV